MKLLHSSDSAHRLVLADGYLLSLDRLTTLAMTMRPKQLRPHFYFRDRGQGTAWLATAYARRQLAAIGRADEGGTSFAEPTACHPPLESYLLQGPVDGPLSGWFERQPLDYFVMVHYYNADHTPAIQWDAVYANPHRQPRISPLLPRTHQRDTAGRRFLEVLQATYCRGSDAVARVIHATATTYWGSYGVPEGP